MAKARVTICSSCIEEFKDNDMYTVQRECHRGHPENGYYRTPYCEDCISRKDSYHKIVKEPKNKAKK